jgi:hypothetical protein
MQNNLCERQEDETPGMLEWFRITI